MGMWTALIAVWCVALGPTPGVVGYLRDVPDSRPDPSLYNIGVGIYDATGPAAGVNMMGYANPAQVNAGIHMRLYSRAFIIDDTQRRFVFVSVDCGMMGQLIKMKVVERLQMEYGGLYDHANVMLSGTHTHSGPAGFLQYLIFDITSLGFLQDSFDALVEGIFQSIKMAHENVVPGFIYVNSGELLESSVNRSPTGYLNNPEDERARYQYDTDKVMTLLKFVAEDGTDLGMVNWFAVHPTSMNNTNQLISGDNKGYASQLFENTMNPGAMPGTGKFVAAFAQTNCGDVSPNTKGPKCIDTGLPCDQETSTCNGRVKYCIAFGPGDNMVESTEIIGRNQFVKAMELYNSATQKLTGPVQFIQQYVDMSNYVVNFENGTQAQTCLPALGYSFAAGTTDGPGAFDFAQGMTEGNPFWNLISGFLHKPSQVQIDCHAPKPILLDTGELNFPYPWHPRIMDTQVGRIGNFLIMPVPGEFSTMAGRRLREKVASIGEAEGLVGATPVIAGLSNVYSHYITTWEEYQIQRYEAASTIFGPHTLSAYIQQYSYLTTSMLRAQEVPAGPLPPDLSDRVLNLLPNVMYDGTGPGYAFGDVIAHPYPLAYTGETVTAKFIGGHPRNNVMLGGTFLTVQRLQEDGSWLTIATDASWETRFLWDRMSQLLGTSVVSVKWDIPIGTPEGTYRITHEGHYKTFLRGIDHYEGVTQSFKVVAVPSTSTESNVIAETGGRRRHPNPQRPWWEKLFFM